MPSAGRMERSISQPADLFVETLAKPIGAATRPAAANLESAQPAVEPQFALKTANGTSTVAAFSRRLFEHVLASFASVDTITGSSRAHARDEEIP